ncbi:enoyl-CoA hydratase/isomerase family protein [Geodermatophilus sp. YIM 151500]|uniref:enoyl-CoA hydratase/isomerase family protein n=1 Tax=Geodermatophilus sp. YIM 151500 TaxID=2984531 RepID=UPI0021E454D7|nr:enoyl-CoA hydratase/isomerase family protein [Geodermatophilus sp. YIM 151500]MCV2488837.1 enoyl-CoA hydratase/isomerase family protein [Geodermatophilus sp. YIM 151500]
MAGFGISPVTDGVAVAELDRGPENLWTLADLRELIAFLVDPPADAHVLRIRSRGEAFCLGRERGGTSTAPGAVRGEAETLTTVTRALRDTRLVTVAEVQGDAAGFGVGVVAACDVSVAVADARFSFPEVGIGLAPALVLAWLPRVVGRRQAFWLTATGEKISAARAQELGLLNGVVASAEELRKDVDDRVAQLRARSPRVHADIRDMLRAFGAVGDDQALDMSLDRLVVGSLRRGEG